MSWLLDTNVFITAARREYGFEFCPGFWEWLVQANDCGRVFSLEKVLAELVPGDDVANWAAARSSRFFLPLSSADIQSLREVAEWAYSGGFAAGAASEFLDIADSQLVAVARARKMTVVTLEVASSSKRRIKVPTACAALRVPYATPYEMLRQEKARFILARSP